jgi:hypothetical protein
MEVPIEKLRMMRGTLEKSRMMMAMKLKIWMLHSM